ncbi:MAG: hypothetical protein V7707_18885 [Motiliproteus sp.]
MSKGGGGSKGGAGGKGGDAVATQWRGRLSLAVACMVKWLGMLLSVVD